GGGHRVARAVDEHDRLREAARVLLAADHGRWAFCLRACSRSITREAPRARGGGVALAGRSRAHSSNSASTSSCTVTPYRGVPSPRSRPGCPWHEVGALLAWPLSMQSSSR